MQSEVMFAGFGGQGILLSAKILAHAGIGAGILKWDGYRLTAR